jgi:hypothetical protein
MRSDPDVREIPGFPGYTATSDGQVLGKSGAPLRAQPHWRTGHLRVRLYTRSAQPRVINRRGSLHLERYRDCYVHVLVALAFLGPRPFDGALVRHLDDVPTHNTPDNLWWGTRADNEADKKRNRAVDEQRFDWSTGELAP